jgi:hypothetical protein
MEKRLLQSGRKLPTFRRNVLLPYVLQKSSSSEYKMLHAWVVETKELNG